jgi:hypothetical protein
MNVSVSFEEEEVYPMDNMKNNIKQVEIVT